MKPDLQRRLLALAALLLAAPLALAQFKVVGPDGKVTYTDRRPESAASGAKSASSRRRFSVRAASASSP